MVESHLSLNLGWIFLGTTRGNKWDGTSWSEINNTNICRYDGGTGTRDNFMIGGGINPFVIHMYLYRNL